MDDKRMQSVSYFLFEENQTRSDRIIHKLIIALLITVGLLFMSNALWLWAWTQYDYTSEEVVLTQDGKGVNIIGSRNGVDYGTEQNNEEENSD